MKVETPTLYRGAFGYNLAIFIGRQFICKEFIQRFWKLQKCPFSKKPELPDTISLQISSHPNKESIPIQVHRQPPYTNSRNRSDNYTPYTWTPTPETKIRPWNTGDPYDMYPETSRFLHKHLPPSKKTHTIHITLLIHEPYNDPTEPNNTGIQWTAENS